MGQLMVIMLLVYVGTIIVYFVSQMLIMTLSRYRGIRGGQGRRSNNRFAVAARIRVAEDQQRHVSHP